MNLIYYNYKGSVVLLIFTLQLIQSGSCLWLGENCSENSDCKPQFSECHHSHKICTCNPYSVEANHTTCLQGTLLGFNCELDAQCALKVPYSGCVNEICSCGSGYVGYRRHTCLSPAKLGEVCFETEQCALADRGSYCKYVVPKVYGRCQCQSGRELNGKNKCSSTVETKIGQTCEEDNDCAMANAYCQRKLDGNSVCTCDIAFTPSSDRKRCLPTYRGILSSTSLGYPCYAHLQCQLADPNSICNGGICDCAWTNGTGSCSAKNNGCHKHTFQCHSDGKCISWHFVCDGKADCEDGSDEKCSLEEGECPSEAFKCGTGSTQSKINKNNIFNSTLALVILAEDNQKSKSKTKCISRSKICDGVRDCDDGSDEEGCKETKTHCPPGTFQCSKTKECLPEHQFCNAIVDCKDDASDEDVLKCRTEFQPSDYCPYRCKNGLCRSSAILCSGVDGCGDGDGFSSSSDEDPERCSVCRCPRKKSLYS